MALFAGGYNLKEYWTDMVVFVAAMVTLQMLGVTTRYKRLGHLIGGLLMLVLGLLLIFRPGWLLFG